MSGTDQPMIDFRKQFFANERDDNLNEIGKPTRRQDITGHVTGRSPFYDDHLFEGLLHMRCARSPHHAARIRRIDASAAERMPGVVRVLVGRDVPRNLNTLLSLLDFGIDDEPLLSTDRVRYRGEPVAAVIATSDARARDAVAAIRVDWEPLPHVLDVEEAVKPGAPVVLDVYPTNKFVYHGKYDHQKLRFGDVEAAFRQADIVVEGRYQMSPIEQAPMETCGAIAAPEQNGRFVCHTSTQALFFSLATASKTLEMPSSRLHFIGGTVGGGFGGKVDSIHEPLAVLGAMLTGRPVKFMWDREEEMQVGAPRGAERWYLKDGVMRDGRIVARRFTGYFDSGAYTRLSSYAIIKGVGHLPGPYTIPNVSADVYCVYTNRTPATAMRGFGITGVDFAIEAHMDKVAEAVGMNPVELRILNAYRDGDMKAHRRLAKNCALIECCQVVAEKAGVKLSPAMLAAASTRDGGGERARLPSHTATDENGRVQGYQASSYAKKGAKQPPPPGALALPPAARTEAPRPAAAQPPPPSTHTPAATAPRAGSMRFSSLSGFRKR
ncbi:xanthine dehydrogenase family protein molybdopterin-binding subunit [Roseomonas sp. HF4]|uniref:xanthine dehydrogenase family protein molybdopterin-binding subunit n=1 Tax=Roseomonas sp. HF4 TaxID=2562313 RepID=UPI00197E8335|nr:molybdopterin cofactor-binding domain-containing protein [Roseomonas sp. HF4]